MFNLSRFTEIASNVLATPQARTPVLLLGKTVFKDDGREVVALQQNPNKPSQWGKLAAENHAVVQFRDANTNAYIGVAVDGVVKLYDGTTKG
jgi:hypothetical protein